MPPEIAIAVSEVRHRYGETEALRGVSLEVYAGETLALLGPNGSGKTTLFKLLSTLMRIESGSITVHGADVATQGAAVRAMLGVVFQSPSLDPKLRIEENLRCHGSMYGLRGTELASRVDEELNRFGLIARRSDLVETLSGGLRRRVELAKCLLHRPRVLVLDEPSTGLDPAARADLWRYLDEARKEGVTSIVTTHLLEEAEKADRIAILCDGQLAALNTPAALQSSVGGDTITFRTADPVGLSNKIQDRFGAAAQIIDGAVRVEQDDQNGLALRVYDELRDQIDEMTLGKPTLEDVFVARTGRGFHAGEEGTSLN